VNTTQTHTKGKVASLTSKPKTVKFDTDQLAEIVADHYCSYNIELDTKDYVWDGMYLELEVISGDTNDKQE
jgi:hypothetical protein